MSHKIYNIGDNGVDKKSISDSLFILMLVLLFIIVNPLYESNNYIILIIQEIYIIFISILFFKLIIHRLPNYKPFIKEILIFTSFLSISLIGSIGIPYLISRSINIRIIFWCGYGSMMIAHIAWIKFYPTFLPKKLESLKSLSQLTLEVLKIGLYMYVIFWLLGGFYIYFSKFMILTSSYDLILFLTGNIVYTICVLGLLIVKYLKLIKLIDEKLR